MVLTEWSSSYSFTIPYHDYPASAPFIVKSVAAMAGLVDVSSYWTFSDVFEVTLTQSLTLTHILTLTLTLNLTLTRYRRKAVSYHPHFTEDSDSSRYTGHRNQPIEPSSCYMAQALRG